MSGSLAQEVLVPRPTKLGPHDPPEIGPYTLLARLGRGGQGEVYLASDDDGNRVAVKVLKVDWDASGTMQRNLDRELVNARKVAQFVTAKVLDFDVVGEPPYIVSEYIEGFTLAEHVRELGPLQGTELLQLAMQTLTALEAIHHARIIHCDFKPANIILGQGGARVIDFGIAQALDSTHRVGEVAGTFPFMAPEQVANKPLTPAVDLFAWGSTMVFAATGEQAFPGGTREAVAHGILTRPPMLHDMEEPLRTIVRACLQKSAERRPTAVQARRMLLDPRRRAARGAGPPPPADAAAPRRPLAQPPPTLVAPPVRSPATASPAANTWKSVAVIIAAVALAAVLAVVWGSPGNTGKETLTETPEPAATTTTTSAAAAGSKEPEEEQGAVADYLAHWPQDDCTTTRHLPRQVVKYQCAISQDDVSMTLFCIQYDGMAAMTEWGRPAGLHNNVSPGDIVWRSKWSRDDSDEHGRFIAYQLDSGKAATWWEDSAGPTACFMHGPEGSFPAMFSALSEHGFNLQGQLPSGN
jgi:hypothetical protein